MQRARDTEIRITVIVVCRVESTGCNASERGGCEDVYIYMCVYVHERIQIMYV